MRNWLLALAASVVAIPTVPSHGTALPLIPAGSFEECLAGCVGGVNCRWWCTANNPAEWIIAPSIPGNGWNVDAYDGILVAWLGGFYGNAPNQNKFCQSIHVVGDCIAWKWMGWVAEGHVGNIVRVTLDGDIVFEKELRYPEDHTYPEWRTLMIDNVNAHCCEPEFCIEIIPTDGANMLVDYFEWLEHCTTGVEDTSFSTIKSYYR